MENRNMLTQQEFLIKYNVQRLLELDKRDDDFAFIAHALDIDLNVVKSIIRSFDDNVKNISDSMKEKLSDQFFLGRENVMIG